MFDLFSWKLHNLTTPSFHASNAIFPSLLTFYTQVVLLNNYELSLRSSLFFLTNSLKRLHIHILRLLSSATGGEQLASNFRRYLMMEMLLQYRLQHFLLLARQLRLVSLYERQ